MGTLTKLGLSLALVAAAQSGVTGAAPDPVISFPLLDASEGELFRRGKLAQAADARYGAAPDSPVAAALLAQVDRVDDALEVLRRAVRGDADQLAATISVVSEHDSDLVRDQAREHPALVREIVDVARARLEELPRDRAAELALALVPVERRVDGVDYFELLGRVADRYAGTPAAELARVESIGQMREVDDRIAARDRYVASNPGTIAAAKALFENGRELQFNARRLQPRGSDPSDRLLRLLAVVEQLEGGQYPRCEWVDLAGTLVPGFFLADDDNVAPANVERLLGALRTYVSARFRLDPVDPAGGGVGRVLTYTMRQLHKRLGDGVGGVEHELELLERHGHDPDDLRYLRGVFYLGLLRQGSELARAELVQRAGQALEGLATFDADRDRPDGPGRHAHMALANLGSLHFREGDHEAAVSRHREFLVRYPSSDYAWLAALRVGQSLQAMGEWESARNAYLVAASAHGHETPGKVLGHALAGQAERALGRFHRALEQFRTALEGWDHAFGRMLVVFSRRESERTFRMETWDQPRLAGHVRRLSRSLADGTGPSLERGRWLSEQGRWQQSREVLGRLVLDHPVSPFVREARYLANRGAFELALDLASIESPKDDDDAALRELAAISDGPWGPVVAAAQIGRATILWKRGETSDALAMMRHALEEWIARQPLVSRGTVSDDPLAADLVAIRDLIFRPLGGGVYAGTTWNGFAWPERLPPFLVVDPVMAVTLHDLDRVEVSAATEIADLKNVLFMAEEDRLLLHRMMAALGGTETRQPTSPMQLPNQPVGPALTILDLWKQFFPTRPGHWFGWVFESYPTLREIRFLDAERSRALGYVTVGYAGATVVLEKRDGVWTATRLANRWVT